MTEHRYGSGELISIDLYCPDCNTRSWDTVPRELANYEHRWDCPDCAASQSVRRIPSAPMVAKASYPDGYKRKGFAELLEASNLQSEISGLKGEDKVKMSNEIAKLEGRNK